MKHNYTWDEAIQRPIPCTDRFNDLPPRWWVRTKAVLLAAALLGILATCAHKHYLTIQ